MIYFSQNLVFFRELKGYTQKQLAEKLLISITKYQSWEEQRAQPSPENLVKICRIFEITDLLSFLSEKLYLKVA